MFQTFSETSLFVPKKRELLFGIFCWFLFLYGAGHILTLFFDQTTFDGYFWISTIADVVCFAAVMIVFWKFLWDSQLMVFPWEMVKAVALGFVLYLALEFIAEWIITDIAIFRYFFLDKPTILYNPNQDNLMQLEQHSPWIHYVCVILLGPVTEELLVRGMIFGPLCKKKPWLAYLVSSTLFAVLHIIAAIGQVSALNIVLLLLMYLPGGIALGWAYQKTRTIYSPILLHCLINLYVTVVNAL